MARNPKPERKWYKLVYGCTKAGHKRYSKLEWKRVCNWMFNCNGTLTRSKFVSFSRAFKMVNGESKF